MKTRTHHIRRILSATLAILFAMQPVSAFAYNEGEQFLSKPTLTATSGYEPMTVLGSDSLVEADVPSTFVGDLDDLSSWSFTEDDLEQDEAFDVNQLRRFMELLSTDGSFSQLSVSDQTFLCMYSGIEQNAWIHAESLDLGLYAASFYLSLAQTGDVSLETVLLYRPEIKSIYDIQDELNIYMESSAREEISASEDGILKAFILEGGTADVALTVYAAHLVTGIGLEQIVHEHEAWELSSIETLDDLFSTEAMSVSESDFDEMECDFVELRNSFIAEPQETGAGDPYFTANYVGTPFMYQYSEHENVNLNSGALEYTTTDYVLPGVNGLDLVIARTYNSQDAVMNTASGKTPYKYPVIFYYDGEEVPETGEPREWHTQRRINFLSQEEAIIAENEWVAQSEHGHFSCDGIRYTYSYQYTTEWENRITDYSNWANTHRNSAADYFGLGQGWRFDFSFIEKYRDERYLHLADGRTIEFEGGLWYSPTLLNYSLEDISLDWGRETFSDQNEESQYAAVYPDGRTEFFSLDGQLIRIEDRFGNRIKFEYSDQNNVNVTTITDTLNRVTQISVTETTDGKSITVTLPDQTELDYEVDCLFGTTSSDQLYELSSVTDPCGNCTQFSYSVEVDGEDLWPHPGVGEVENVFLNLSTITHPTNAQTVFTYDESNRTLAPFKNLKVYKVASRHDIVAEETLNLLTYDFTEYDYTLPSFGGSNGEEDYSVTITNAEDTITYIEFDSSNLMTYYKLKEGSGTLKQVSYTYNSNGLPISETSEWGSFSSVIRKTYDVKGNILSERSPLGENSDDPWYYYTDYTYSDDYNLVLSREYYRQFNTPIIWQYELSNDNKSIAKESVYVQNTKLKETQYTYDSYGNVTQMRQVNLDNSDPDILTDYTYQNHAYLATVSTYYEGQTPTVQAQNVYDTVGRLVSSTDGNGNTTTYTYNALGALTQITNPDNSTVSYSINYGNNYVTVTDERGNAVKYKYTPLGLEDQIVDVSSQQVIRQMNYDSMSRLESVENYVYGAVTSYTYDALDQILSKTVMQGNDTIYHEAFEYVYAGTWKSVETTVNGSGDTPDITTIQYFDRAGNVFQEGRCIGNQKYLDVYTFNFAGEVETYQSAKDRESNRSFTEKYAYGLPGQVLRTTNTLNQFTENAYDSFGRLICSTDYAGTPTYYEYDALGRMTQQTVTISSNATAVTNYEYDGVGNLICEKTPANAASGQNEVRYTYDNRNRLISAVQYDGQIATNTTSYTYDASGNMLTMTNGGHTTTYTYDRFSNILSMTDPMNHSETYTYSTLGKPLSKTDRNGTTISYQHDALGRIVSIQAGTGTDADVINYEYTKTGQVAVAENNWNKTKYSYDTFGRVTTVSEYDRADLASHYDYTVTLNANGGSVDLSQILVSNGDTYFLPTPVRIGYTFAGWYLGTQRIETGDTVSLTGNATFLAHWTANTYTVTLDASGGSVNPATLSVSFDGTYVLPTPERVGYSFDGWYLGNTLISSGDTVELLQDSTFVAHWTANTYTVTLNANGGTVSPTSVQVTYGQTYSLPDAAKADAEFTGWYFGNQLIQSGDTVAITQNCTFTAGWRLYYTVALDYADGVTDPGTLIAVDDQVTLPVPSRTGYTFQGWYSGNTWISMGGTISVSANMTLTAHWTANTYTVTFDPDGGTVSPTSICGRCGRIMADQPCPPTPACSLWSCIR